MTTAYQQLTARLADVATLGDVMALLGWDLQTQMPHGAGASRARHRSVMTRMQHEMFTAAETGRLLDAAEKELQNAPYDSDEASMVRVTRHDYDLARKLPAALVSEIAQTTALAHESWTNARKNNDFKSFVPSLERIYDLMIRKAELLGYSAHIYDALLDEYEPGMKSADVVSMFEGLRKDLVPLVKAISAKQGAVDDSVLHQQFDEGKQREFSEMVIREFGYDFNRGRQDRAVHPFCTSFSRDDVRITTRYSPDWLNPAMFGTFHETGHALYEQGSPESLEGNVLRGGVSLGIHESQSRLWENVVGRSRVFWSHFFPKLQAYFPDQLGKVDLETFYRAINKVSPSFIRVEADEVTYNLHIMVRLELEMALVSRQLKIADLPEAWNARYQEYLGIVPPTDTVGVLQDIHWSMGLVGYFSTYSLGNLLSVQLYEKAVEMHPEILSETARGEFRTLLGWMRKNIHVHGRKFEPKELVKRATGEAMNAGPYMRYLRTKYGEIYGI